MSKSYSSPRRMPEPMCLQPVCLTEPPVNPSCDIEQFI
uniref:Uncharacterized protein n=1 Tax=Rhizophora mucronata TaxID=61149 RepID=A0A2P2J6P7_RHIMU